MTVFLFIIACLTLFYFLRLFYRPEITITRNQTVLRARSVFVPASASATENTPHTWSHYFCLFYNRGWFRGDAETDWSILFPFAVFHVSPPKMIIVERLTSLSIMMRKLMTMCSITETLPRWLYMALKQEVNHPPDVGADSWVWSHTGRLALLTALLVECMWERDQASWFTWSQICVL